MPQIFVILSVFYSNRIANISKVSPFSSVLSLRKRKCISPSNKIMLHAEYRVARFSGGQSAYTFDHRKFGDAAF